MSDSNDERLRALQADLERDDVTARREYLEHVETFSLEQVNALTPVVRVPLGPFEGYVTRLEPRRRVLSVSQNGTELFPAFQWMEGQLVPVVSVVCRLLDSQFTQWREAFWFVSPNGWLAGLAPIDLLSSQPEEVVLAAHYAWVDVAFPD